MQKKSANLLPQDVEFSVEDDCLLFEGSPGRIPTALETDYQRWMMDLLVNPKFEEFFDIDLVIRETERDVGNVIRAHRLILATRNLAFGDLLRNQSGNQFVIVDPNVSRETFRLLVCFIYTGRARIPSPIRIRAICSLMYAAQKYQVNQLYGLIKDFIMRELNRDIVDPSQIIVTFQAALDYDLQDLVPLCTHLFERRTADIRADQQFTHIKANLVSHILDLDVYTGVTEREMFQSIVRWSKLQLGRGEDTSANGSSGQSLRDVMEPFIHKFRLLSVMKDDLTAIITDSGVFAEKEQLKISLYLLGRSDDLGEFSKKIRKTVYRHSSISARSAIPTDLGHGTHRPAPLSENHHKNRMSRSIGNVSKLHIPDFLAPFRRRKLNRDNRPSTAQLVVQDTADDDERTNNGSIGRGESSKLARTTAMTDSLSSNSEKFFGTLTERHMSQPEAVPSAFTRKIYDAKHRHNLFHLQKLARHRSQDIDAGRRGSGANNSPPVTRRGTIHAIDIEDYPVPKFRLEPSTAL